jgi:hypothetical protein
MVAAGVVVVAAGVAVEAEAEPVVAADGVAVAVLRLVDGAAAAAVELALRAGNFCRWDLKCCARQTPHLTLARTCSSFCLINENPPFLLNIAFQIQQSVTHRCS